MERKNNILNKIFSPKLLVIEWSFIVLFCIFIGCSVRASAATNPDYSLPLTIGIPERLADDTGINSNIVNQAIQGYLDILLNQYSFDGSDNYTVFIAGRDDKDLTIIVTYNLTCGHLPENDPNFSEDWENLYYNNISQHYVEFQYDGDTETLSSGNFYGGWVSTWSFNRANINYGMGWVLASVNEIPDYWIFPTSEQPEFNGHATPPDLTGDNIGSDKPDLDDYLPNIPTIPSLDNSSIEKIAESIFSILAWGFNAIKGILQGLFEYLADTFTYSIQKVIDNIKNAIQNFYDNMKSLFEPLLNGLAQIGQAIKQTIENIGLLLEAFFAPFDEDQFQEAYNNCQFISAVDGFKDSIEEFKHAFEYAEERDYYTLYLGFIMDGYTVNYDLDFTWLYPLRQYYRPIIWCVVVYEFFVYLCAQLSDYLQGRSGK